MIRNARLVRRQKAGIVHREIELCTDPATSERYLPEQGYTDPAGASPSALPAALSRQAATTSRPFTDADTVLLQRLARGHWKTIKQHQRNRTILRIGERCLHAAVPTLADLIDRGDTMQDYCIAWAIGRCGDTDAAEAMR